MSAAGRSDKAPSTPHDDPSSAPAASVDVIIVGAGLSGLAAAYEILCRDPSVNVKVLEANSRVGGRNFLDDGVDKGAGYIGPTQDRIMRLVDLLGLEVYKVNTAGKTVQYVRGVASRFDGTIPPISPIALLDINAALVEVDRIAETINLEQPHLSPNAEKLDNTTVEEYTRRRCWSEDVRNMMRTCVRVVLCVEPCEVSVLAFCWYIKTSGNIKRIIETENGAQDSKVLGGTGRISIELAKRIPAGWLHLDSPVRFVDYTSDASVTVVAGSSGHAAQCQTFTAKTLILAIPPNQQSRIEFSPPLAPNRVQALAHWPMGHIIKTFTFYDRPFWKERQLSGAYVADEGISVVGFDDSKPDGSTHCIMAFVTSTEAAKWSARTPEDRKRALAEHFAKIFDAPEAHAPCDYKEQNWAEQPWAGGCYVGVPQPGALFKFKDEVSRCQIAPNVFVAGTEAARLSVGYMDGAVEAGERSGRNALVRLGKLPATLFEVVSRPPPSKQMPFVEMELSALEKYFTPSVGQALGIVLVAGAAAAAAVAWGVWKRSKL
jgi:monoamine oxidase